MSKRKKPQPEPEGEPDNNGSQMLQRIKKENSFGAPVNDGSEARARNTMRRMNEVVRIYEETGGNISATCRFAGITRRSFYRWMNPASTARLHKRFQTRINRIKPLDVLIDAAQLTIAQKISQGDLTAAMFVMNKLGHKRGWTEKPQDEINAASVNGAIIAVRSYQLWLADHPQATEAEKAKWLSGFARTNGVGEDEVIRTMKIQELTASVQ